MVCIFAEGAISRTGNLLPFKRGFEKIVEGLECRSSRCISTGCGAASSASSGGTFLLEVAGADSLSRSPCRFGAPLPSTPPAHEVRQAILELGSRGDRASQDRRDLLHLRFIRTARRHWSSSRWPIPAAAS